MRSTFELGTAGEKVGRYARVAPRGPRIIYAHGSGSSATAVSRDPDELALIRELTDIGDVVAADFGLETWGNDLGVERIRSYLGPGPVVLVGLSMGGCNVLNYARAYPDDVIAVAGIIPLVDLDEADALFASASLDAAYPNPATHRWQGIANQSASERVVNGQVVAVNHHPGANARTNNSNVKTVAWAGGSGNVVNTPASVASAFAKSGYEWKHAYTAVTVPNSGDVGLTLRRDGLTQFVAPGEKWTMAFTVRRSTTGTVGATRWIGANGAGTYTVHAQSHPSDSVLAANTERRVWATVSYTGDAVPARKVGVNMWGASVGLEVSVYDVDLYPGDYDPARDWFAGDSPVKNLGYRPAFDAPLHSPVKFAADLPDELPIHLFSSSNDPYTTPGSHQRFAAARPQTELTDIGPIGHGSWAAAWALPHVLPFVRDAVAAYDNAA